MTELNKEMLVKNCDEESCECEATCYVFQADKEAVECGEEIEAEGLFVCDEHKESTVEL